MSQTKINIYKGNQIGGCVTIISTQKSSICIDFGEDLPGSKNYEKDDFQIDGVNKGKRKIDAVFFTHYHGDHIGRIKEILKEIPLYMGKTTKKVLESIYRIVNKDIYDILEDKNRVFTFTENKRINIGDIAVTPFSVDHSAYDAYMFLIETPDKVILHTGNLRMHGYRAYSKKNEEKTLISVVKKYVRKNGGRKIDILITEGTMMSRVNDEYYTEEDLQNDAKKYMQDKEHKYVFLICSSTNLDSLASFYNAGQQLDKPRKIYGNGYIIEQLDNFSRTAGKKSEHYNFKNKEHFSPDSYSEKLKSTQEERMKENGFITIIKGEKKYEEWIERFSDWNPKPCLIYSMWEGYINPKCDAYNPELAELCKKYNAKHLHTSGHIYTKDLAEFIRTVNPEEAIIPIHTENQGGFNNLDMSEDLKNKIKQNVTEYECTDDNTIDNRAITTNLLKEFQEGGAFYEFTEFVKENKETKLALCFRGNGTPENVCIYLNNHIVWKLYKDINNKYVVGISFNHARYSENWEDMIKRLKSKKFNFKKYKKDRLNGLKEEDSDNYVIEKKDKNGKKTYGVGDLYSFSDKPFSKEFVCESFEIIKKYINDFFAKDKNRDYFKEYITGNTEINKKKPEYLEKRVQQKLYLKFGEENKNDSSKLYIYDLEFAQRKLRNEEKHNNHPDMHGIRFENGKPVAFVAVEVKSTEYAMKDKNSGFKPHLLKMEEYLTQNSNAIKRRLNEAKKIIEQYQILDLHEANSLPKDLDFSNLGLEIKMILTDDAAKYFKRNIGHFQYNGQHNLKKFLDDKDYTISEQLDENGRCYIEINKAFKNK